MSEYQYYEFQAIDCPLSEADMEALRAVSTRAQITASRFTNHYNWGDFKGNPKQFMENWFDLHLHLASWGTRELMIRLPKRFVDRTQLDPLLQRCDDLIRIIDASEYWIMDIHIHEEEPKYDNWDEGDGWLGSIAPLRIDLLSGDWRLCYLLWLRARKFDDLEGDELEPLAGIGPLIGSLSAAADFFASTLTSSGRRPRCLLSVSGIRKLCPRQPTMRWPRFPMTRRQRCSIDSSKVIPMSSSRSENGCERAHWQWVDRPKKPCEPYPICGYAQ